MKLRRGKTDYKVPLVERLEGIYLNDKVNGFHWVVALISNEEMAKMSQKKKPTPYGIPSYAS